MAFNYEEVNSHLNKRFTNLTRLETMDETTYENLVLREARIEILFDGLHSVWDCESLLRCKCEDLSNDRFSHCDSFWTTLTAYFVNDENKQLYSAKIDEV